MGADQPRGPSPMDFCAELACDAPWQCVLCYESNFSAMVRHNCQESPICESCCERYQASVGLDPTTFSRCPLCLKDTVESEWSFVSAVATAVTASTTSVACPTEPSFTALPTDDSLANPDGTSLTPLLSPPSPTPDPSVLIPCVGRRTYLGQPLLCGQPTLFYCVPRGDQLHSAVACYLASYENLGGTENPLYDLYVCDEFGLRCLHCTSYSCSGCLPVLNDATMVKFPKGTRWLSILTLSRCLIED